ncbi:MAG: ATP-binding protein [Prevotella sp.]|mgnify:FL=1|nr:ATP-binding protein [Prevotella sp.]
MEKNMMISTPTPSIDLKTMWQKLTATVKSPIEWLRIYYSSVCGKTLSMGQTLLLINAQLAFISAAFPADLPLIARLGCCTWLLASLKLCRDKI